MPTPLHPLPPSAPRWGYDHSPPVYGRADAQATAQTSGTVAGSLLRLVGGYTDTHHGDPTWSRGWDSWISLDTYSIGVAHWWADTAPDLLARIVTEQPVIADWAWGEGVAIVREPDILRAYTGTARGKRDHDPDLDWLLAGWYEIARHPLIVRIQADAWLSRYAATAWDRMQRWGWHRASSLAALARVANSGGLRHFDSARKALGSRADESDVCELALGPGRYDHPERWDAILRDGALAGDVSRMPTVDDLRINGVLPRRVDGTVPVMMSEPRRWREHVMRTWRSRMHDLAHSDGGSDG